jgi:hypothetical protein
MRQVDLGLDFVGIRARAARRTRSILRFPSGVEMRAHFLRLEIFNRAGMGLFLCYPDEEQHVENSSAFYFQLSSQIVDSNLHPPFPTSGLVR